MKINFVINNLQGGGAERVISYLCNYFSEKKYKVKLILLNGNDVFYSLHKNIEIISQNKSKGFFSDILFLRKNIKDSDISISFTTGVNIVNILSCLTINTKSVISERTNHLNKNVSLKLRILRFTYSFSSFLVVLSDLDFKYYSKFVRRISIITNPFQPKLKINSNRDNIILNVGRLENVKNQIFLLKSFNHCIQKLNLRNWKLILIGEGSNRDEIEIFIKKYNLEQSVDILGLISNVESFYNKSKIYCLTSKHEGFPNSLLEAYCYGCACISLNIKTGPSQIINHNIDGLLIDESISYINFADQLMKLANNQQLIDKFHVNAIQNNETHKIENKLSEWEKILIKVKN